MVAGDIVKILPPFDEGFPGEYVISAIDEADDGQTVFYLVGIESAFAEQYIEVVNGNND